MEASVALRRYMLFIGILNSYLLLEKVPECRTALSDKFGNVALIQNALMERGSNITLHQETKAERDIAVAAASILARDEFVRRIKLLAEPLGVELPKGASLKVEKTAEEIVKTHGWEMLAKLAKMHFRTVEKLKTGIGRL